MVVIERLCMQVNGFFLFKTMVDDKKRLSLVATSKLEQSMIDDTDTDTHLRLREKERVQ